MALLAVVNARRVTQVGRWVDGDGTPQEANEVSR
jgi:hypothetical protein